MQRCPYLHEMKERLLGAQRANTLVMESFDRERDTLLENTSRPGSNQVPVATVVKVRLSSLATPQRIQVILKFSFDYFQAQTFCSHFRVSNISKLAKLKQLMSRTEANCPSFALQKFN